MTNTSDDIQRLKSVPLFSSMDDQEISAIRSIMDLNIYVPGQVIIREGDKGEHFHVIIEGTVEFMTCDASGQELILDDAGAGGYFGELSMITGLPRTLRVRAKDQVTTLALDREEFHDFLIKHPHAGIDVLTVLGKRLYRTDTLLKKSVSKNVNDIIQEKLTLGDRIADGFATMMGSWRFIITQSIILICWVVLNVTAWIQHWDPYPFILLNLALSFQAAYAAPIIMMSQNRQAEKDRLAAEVDHDVNVKAEIKTGVIMSRLDDIEKEMHFLHKEVIKNLNGKT